MVKKKVSPIKSYNLKRNGELRYEFPIYIGVNELTGKQMRSTKRGFKSYKEAELALARIKLDIAKGTYRQKRVETYQEVYDLWIKKYENTVEESTFIKTEGIFKNHILPAMSTYKIQKIHADICQKHVDDWASKLKKYRMVKAYAAKVIDFAIKREYLLSNPFSYVDLPTTIAKKKMRAKEDKAENYYTREQLKKFLSCLKSESNYKAYVLFLLLAFSGIRRGEALALTWDDLDFKKNEILINKAIGLGKNNKLYVKPPKTGAARSISMDEKVMAILKDWKKIQKLEYLKLGINTGKDKQLVFSNEKNEFLQPTKLRKWITHVQAKYELPKITTHGLRHTHCSLLFEAKASLKQVQDRLGHTDVRTTLNIYTHVTKESKEDARLKFSNYMEVSDQELTRSLTTFD